MFKKKIDLDEICDLRSVLLEFESAIYDGDKNDQETINRCIEEMSPPEIKGAIKEGKEILQLEPFPWEWVSNITNKLVYDEEKKDWVEDEVLYKKWVTWIVEALETEGKRIGKL